MSKPLHVVVLAAGQGTRMKSALPKVLHPIAGVPMLGHVLRTAAALKAAKVHVVLGHGEAAVRAWHAQWQGLKSPVQWVQQKQQKGTAHAVQQAMPGIPDSARVLVVYGDVPLIRAATLRPLAAAKAGLAVLSAEVPDPTGYGRVLRDAKGKVQAIVEHKDATAAQRALREINTGFMAADAKLLRGWLDRVRNRNAKKEFYLTDIVGFAADDGVAIRGVSADAGEVEGVNDRAQLGLAERRFQLLQALALQRHGLGLGDAQRFDLRGTLRFGTDCHIDVGVVLEGEVVIGDGVRIGPYCVLRDVRLGAGTVVASHSVLESATAGRDCRIGPFARLRPESQLADAVHIGNFVEVKKTTLGRGSKANHLAYLGDGTVGADVNVGAGTIFCNYDGAAKHQTVIGDQVFIGSDTQLVAPVTIGKGATIAAGSTISRDVAAGGLTVCRAKEHKHYPNWRRPVKKPGAGKK